MVSTLRIDTAHTAGVSPALTDSKSALNPTDVKTQKVSKSFFSSFLSFIGKAFVAITFPVSLPLLWVASKIANILVRVSSAHNQEKSSSPEKEIPFATRDTLMATDTENTDRTLALINDEIAIDVDEKVADEAEQPDEVGAFAKGLINIVGFGVLAASAYGISRGSTPSALLNAANSSIMTNITRVVPT
jgi:hypothetical protein